MPQLAGAAAEAPPVSPPVVSWTEAGPASPAQAAVAAGAAARARTAGGAERWGHPQRLTAALGERCPSKTSVLLGDQPLHFWL